MLPALLWHFKRYTTQTSIFVNFTHHELSARFIPEIETAAYRIVQEGLTNVARHACASEVSVYIHVDQYVLNIHIDDMGAGFDLDAATASGSINGITGMHERVMFLGGHFKIESSPGAGTHLTARLPLASLALIEQKGDKVESPL